MSNYSDETTQAISTLVVKQPFFAAFLFDRMVIVEDETTKTAKTNGRTIWVGPWFRKLPVQQRVFVICHEILHGIMMHCQRAKLYKDLGVGPDMKPFSFKRWNTAGDYIINDVLVADSVGQAVPGMLLDSSIATAADLLDEVYTKLPDEPEEQGDGGDGGDGPSGGPGEGNDSGGTGNFDEHEMAPEPVSDSDTADCERAVMTAANAAKAQGSLPGGLRKFLDDVLNPKLKWQDLLRRHMYASARSGENDWSKPNRRKLAFSAVTAIDLPIYASKKASHCGTVVVQIDTSGSISMDEATKFLGEIKGIVEDCQPSELYVLWTDAKVAKVDLLMDDMSSELDAIIARVKAEGVPGGGGTDMRKGFEYLEEWGIEAESFVTFTDGYTPWPTSYDGYHLAVVTVDRKVEAAKAIGDAVGL